MDMKRGEHKDLCPRFHFAVELIGRRWTGAILFVLEQGPERFSGLGAAIEGITDPMLAARLRELDREGIVERTVLPGAPVGVKYSLTPKGRALGKVLRAIGAWSHAWVPEQERESRTVARRGKAAARATSRAR